MSTTTIGPYHDRQTTLMMDKVVICAISSFNPIHQKMYDGSWSFCLFEWFQEKMRTWTGYLQLVNVLIMTSLSPSTSGQPEPYLLYVLDINIFWAIFIASYYYQCRFVFTGNDFNLSMPLTSFVYGRKSCKKHVMGVLVFAFNVVNSKPWLFTVFLVLLKSKGLPPGHKILLTINSVTWDGANLYFAVEKRPFLTERIHILD